MKDHLETAPVWDAVRQTERCPFCALRSMIEKQSVERFLGGAVMEPGIRIRTNAAGFCSPHHRMLMAQKDYHGYALMMDTRLKEARAQAAPVLSALAKGSLFGGRNTDKAARKLREITSRCLVCESMRDHVKAYRETFFRLPEKPLFGAAAYAAEELPPCHGGHLRRLLRDSGRRVFSIDDLNPLTKKTGAEEAFQRLNSGRHRRPLHFARAGGAGARIQAQLSAQREHSRKLPRDGGEAADTERADVSLPSAGDADLRTLQSFRIVPARGLGGDQRPRWTGGDAQRAVRTQLPAHGPAAFQREDAVGADLRTARAGLTALQTVQTEPGPERRTAVKIHGTADAFAQEAHRITSFQLRERRI